MTAVPACSQCVFWRVLRDQDGLCRRNAPEPNVRAEGVAHWPQTHAREGCGDGATAREGVVACAQCLFWRARATGLDPTNRADMPKAWWAHAGVCHRHAPKPSGDAGPRGFWRATAATDGCGEGRAAN